MIQHLAVVQGLHTLSCFAFFRTRCLAIRTISSSASCCWRADFGPIGLRMSSMGNQNKNKSFELWSSGTLFQNIWRSAQQRVLAQIYLRKNVRNCIWIFWKALDYGKLQYANKLWASFSIYRNWKNKGNSGHLVDHYGVGGWELVAECRSARAHNRGAHNNARARGWVCDNRTCQTWVDGCMASPRWSGDCRDCEQWHSRLKS